MLKEERHSIWYQCRNTSGGVSTWSPCVRTNKNDMRWWESWCLLFTSLITPHSFCLPSRWCVAESRSACYLHCWSLRTRLVFMVHLHWGKEKPSKATSLMRFWGSWCFLFTSLIPPHFFDHLDSLMRFWESWCFLFASLTPPHLFDHSVFVFYTCWCVSESRGACYLHRWSLPIRLPTSMMRCWESLCLLFTLDHSASDWSSHHMRSCE